MTTLIPSFVILDISRAAALPDASLPGGCCLAWSIRLDDLPAAASFYKMLFSSRAPYPFCLMITEAGAPVNVPPDSPIDLLTAGSIDELADLVASISFHHRYHKVDFGVPVLLFDAPSSAKTGDPGRVARHDTGHKLLSACRDALLEQGYDDVKCIPVDTTLRPDNLRDPVSVYANALNANHPASLSLFISLEDPAKLPELTGLLCKADEWVQRTDPRAYTLLRAYRQQLDAQSDLRFRIGLLQQQLASQHSYHSWYNPSAGHVRKQITEITDFYKYEYEILPLWYKRFGHIIKVLMGKRSFRSLFNDHVKKYKD